MRTVKLQKKYPLRMGCYLTSQEREDIERLHPDTGPDWSEWQKTGLKAATAALKGWNGKNHR